MAWEYLLARASWDTDGIRDDLRDYVTDQLGTPTRCWCSTYADTVTMPRTTVLVCRSRDCGGLLRRSCSLGLGIVSG
jgi:hypothetical protein